MRTLALPKAAEPWSLTSLREKLIKIGVKVVSHGRYVTFQLAEVAVSRQMFAEILMLIAQLRAPCASMSSAGSGDAPAMTAEVRPGASKATHFSASVQSTSWFARLLARDARSTVAQNVRTGDPGPQQPGIRGMLVQMGRVMNIGCKLLPAA